MNKTLYVSIDSLTALSLYSEEYDETVASWDGKAPTLHELNAAAQRYFATKQAMNTEASEHQTTETKRPQEA